MIERLIINSLMAYAVTFIITSSSLLAPFRAWLICRTKCLQIQGHKHFLECRMCVGFWASVAVCNTDWRMILPVYGLSYLLATQERR